MSGSDILNISKIAMDNSNSAIASTAKNISNVNTEGYKRRRIDFTGYQQETGSIGLNLQYGEATVSRIREQFVDAKILQENQNLGKYQTDSLILPQIEDIFGEPNEASLNNMLSQFWSAWNDLAVDPENLADRNILVDKGQNLASAFTRVHSDLKSLQNQISLDIEGKVDEINNVLGQLDKINGMLRNIRVGTHEDLLDERDMLLNKLTQMVNADVTLVDNGAVNITSGGVVLLSPSFKNTLSVETDIQDGFITSTVQVEKGTVQPELLKGELGSLVQLNSEIIPDYVAQVDAMAINVTQEVNQVHRTGYNLDGVTGVDFFDPTVTSAGNMRVSQALTLDSTLVAASDTSGEAGNGNLAQKIADLKSDTFMDGMTLDNYYSGIITDVGNRVQENNFLLTSQEKVMTNLKNQQDSVSGVSNDEEMTNLIKYQQSYQAAARLVTTSRDLMDILMNMV